MARLTEFTIEHAKIILERFSNGEKLKNIFKDKGMPKRATFYKIIHANTELINLYTRAREFHGEQFMDEIEQIKDDLRDKTLTPNEARVLTDTIKWQACKYYPRMFGDKIALDHQSSDGSMSPTKEADLSKLSDKELKQLEKLQDKIEKK